jgi:hypothetical protein
MNVKKAVMGAILAFAVMALLLGSAGVIFPEPSQAPGIPVDPPESVGEALWDVRAMDVVFQMAIIIAGSFGVLALVQEVRRRD